MSVQLNFEGKTDLKTAFAKAGASIMATAFSDAALTNLDEFVLDIRN